MNPWLIGVPGALVAAGAATSYAAVNAGSQLFGATVRGTASPRELAITFDDGPNPAVTPKLLDQLDTYGVKATFFVIGRFVRECPALSKEIAARGHLLGNHTENHPNLFWLPPAGIREELRRCSAALEDVVGVKTEYFRPPWGYRNPWTVSVARELGMRTVMWTLIPGDWHERPAEWLIGRMRPIERHGKNADARRAGDVLCLHDGAHRGLGGDRGRTVKALEYWLPRWRDLGLKFVTISDAVRTPAR
jgi:peptidoglycan/xylan/chitin deacetylase (PgdA/CDA1 family)